MEIFSSQGCKYYTLLIHFIMKKKVNKDIIAKINVLKL